MLFVGTKTVSAVASFMPQFGGRIIHTKAVEIESLEAMGFLCPTAGSTISITPIGSPTGTPISYFIPYGIYSKTGHNTRAGQLIIGKYSLKTIVNCTLAHYIIPVSLDTITLFGNSR